MRKLLLLGGCAGVLVVGCLVLAGLVAVGGRVQSVADAQRAMPEPTMIGWYRDNADRVDPRALAADPKAYVGKNVTLTGKVLGISQHDDHTWAQLMADVPGRDGQTESIVTYWRPKNPAVLSGERFQVWAIVQGSEEVRRQLTGATNTSPVVNVYTYTVR